LPILSLSPETYRKGIYSSSIWNIIAKAAVFLNTILIVFYFGSDVHTDVYYYIISFSLLLPSIINGIDPFVLIPEGVRLREQNGEHQSREFFNFFIWVYAAIGFLFILIVSFETIPFFKLVSSFDETVITGNEILFKCLPFLCFFQLVNGLLTSIIITYKFFTVSILISLVNSLLVSLLTVFFHASFGISIVLYVLIAGNILSFLMLVHIYITKLQWNFFSVSGIGKKVWGNIGWMQLNLIPIMLKNFCIIFLLSEYANGMITNLNIAQQIVAIPVVLISAQLFTVLGLKLAELTAKNEKKEINLLINSIGGMLLFIMVPIAVYILFFSHEIIEVLVQRGNFKGSSVETASICLMYLALVQPAAVIESLIGRLFSAAQIYGFNTIIATITHTISLLIFYFCIQRWGLTGYLLATNIGSNILNMLMFNYLMKIKLPYIDRSAFFGKYFRILVINTFAGLLLYFFKPYIDFNPYFSLIAGGIFLMITISAFNYFLKIESVFSSEVKTIFKTYIVR